MEVPFGTVPKAINLARLLPSFGSVNGGILRNSRWQGEFLHTPSLIRLCKNSASS
jgi:hypothetical protein